MNTRRRFCSSREIAPMNTGTFQAVRERLPARRSTLRHPALLTLAPGSAETRCSLPALLAFARSFPPPRSSNISASDPSQPAGRTRSQSQPYSGSVAPSSPCFRQGIFRHIKKNKEGTRVPKVSCQNPTRMTPKKVRRAERRSLTISTVSGTGGEGE